MFQTAIRKLVVASGTKNFRGKGWLINHWLAHRPRAARAQRTLPGGARVECDLAFDYDCMVYLEQEEEVDLRVLRELLRPGEMFIDCGANIGLWTLVAASSVHDGKVVAFEPNPATAARLRRHVLELNDLGHRVRIVEAAVSDQHGTGALAPGDSHNVSRLREAADETTVAVTLTTIDREVGEADVAGIKLDVEGSELDALRGAASALTRHRPWICVEFNTLLAQTAVLGQWPVDGFLRDRGYVPRLFRDAFEPESATLPPTWEAAGYVNLFYSSVP